MNDPAENEIKAFVGPKADYYLKKWRLDVDGSGSVAGFNWAALLFSGLWIAYRKMYRVAGIFFGVILLESILEEVLYVGILGRPEAPVHLSRFVGLVAGIVCGGFANEWYLSHTQKTIAQVRSQGLPEDVYLGVLARRGGTSLAGTLGALVVFLIVTFAALLALEPFLGRD